MRRRSIILLLLLFGGFLVGANTGIGLALLVRLRLAIVQYSSWCWWTGNGITALTRFLLLFEALLLLQFKILTFNQCDECVASALQLQSRSRLEEPVKAKLWGAPANYISFVSNAMNGMRVRSMCCSRGSVSYVNLPNGWTKVFIDVLLVET